MLETLLFINSYNTVINSFKYSILNYTCFKLYLFKQGTLFWQGIVKKLKQWSQSAGNRGCRYHSEPQRLYASEYFIFYIHFFSNFSK